MAILTNNSSGNFTTAATWSVIDQSANAFKDTETFTTALTTSFVGSVVTFTPGAITIDGIGVKVSTRTVSAATVSVRLAIGGVAVSGTTVTINASDFNIANTSWVFFKFATPVTLLAATAYTLQASCSIASAVTLFRGSSAADYSRYLRTTTTQAPAAGDDLYICGEFLSAGVNNTLTVTMNNTTSTIFGAVYLNEKGTLTYGTSASTNYQLICGAVSTLGMWINGGGILNIGTSGTPIPSTSTATLQIYQLGSTVVSGISIRNKGTLNTYGATKTGRAYLAADASIAATSLTTNISTGWKNGDTIVLASTTRTAAETEAKTLTADASGTTLTISALTNAHSGTAPTIAELANLTRNVVIKGETISSPMWITTTTDSIVNANYTEFAFMGSATANKRGIEILVTTGTASFVGCSIRNNELSSALGIFVQGTGTVTIDDCVFYRINNNALLNISTSTNLTVNNCWCFANIIAGGIIVSLSINSGTSITNCVASGSTAGSGFSLQFGTIDGAYTLNNLTSHSNATLGIGLSANSYNKLTLSNLIIWRNTTRGLYLNGTSGVSIDTGTIFGNVTCGVEFSSSWDISLSNLTIDAGVTLTQPRAIILTGSNMMVNIDNCSFGATTAHATSDVQVATANSYNDVNFNNCLFAGTTEIATPTNLMVNNYIGSSKHDQTAKTHKAWGRNGTISYDSVLTVNSPSSKRITPSNASSKMLTSDKRFAIPSGKTANISVSVRRSVVGDGTAYNGALPRLWIRSNTIGGPSTDTLLATATAASSGAFEMITGTIPASTADTINSIFVDCDGTTGWVNIDQWKVDIINGSANAINVNNETFWADGTSFMGVNSGLMLNSGSETYWKNGLSSTRLYPVGAAMSGKFFLIFNEG